MSLKHKAINKTNESKCRHQTLNKERKKEPRERTTKGAVENLFRTNAKDTLAKLPIFI